MCIRDSDHPVVKEGGSVRLTYTYDHQYAAGDDAGTTTGQKATIRITASRGSVEAFGETVQDVSKGSYTLDLTPYLQAGVTDIYVRATTTDPETGRAVATEREIVDTRGRTFTVRTAATCVYAKEPLPQGTGSLYGIIDYFAGKYTLRVTNREAEFSGTAAHSAATRPTDGRPARTTRTTQTTRTTRTMRAGVTAATPPTAYP